MGFGISYKLSLEGLTADRLTGGFFENWKTPLSPAAHLKLLRESSHVVLAIDDASGHVIGFINAISDNVLSAYIPLLEVLPAYRGQGIGQELVRRMLRQLSHLNMVDLTCDKSLVPYYKRFGMTEACAMMIRRHQPLV